MQNLFGLPWCTDSTSEEKTEKAMLPMMRHSSVVDIPLLSKLKRKRADSQQFDPLPEDAKRRKLSDAQHHALPRPGKWENDAPTNGGPLEPRSCNTASHTPSKYPQVEFAPYTTENPTVGNDPSTKRPAAIAQPPSKPTQSLVTESKPELSEEAKRLQLQQIIEHQFNLEILLKHRELRLIEQELAKCQVSLEQLRRCEIIPYPGCLQLSESLSHGVGPAIKPDPGFTQPQAPAPWGVTDGPYSRHYSRWLLNDPTYDSMPYHEVFPSADIYGMPQEGRSTRNSGAGLGKAGKTRSGRDSFGNLSQALPNYPAQSRGKQGPLVIRRLADNLFVKLICNNCQRGDFSSVQGFLNHCRIAHKVDYKSHEAAALDCGRPLEDDEAHLAPQGGAAAPTAPVAPKPQAPKAIATAAAQPSTVGFVHPLNAPVMPRYTWKRQYEAARAHSSQAQARSSEASNKATITHAANVFHATPLIGSSATPYLSAQFARRGLGGDLKRVIAQSREKVDLGPELIEEDDVSPTPTTGRPAGNMRPTATAAQEGRKGQHQSLSRPRPAPIVSQQMISETPEFPNDVNLSPHTADSNPGLVSDHEDDDAASDLDEARSERHESPPPVNGLGRLRGNTCGEAIDVDVEVEDEGDVHSVLIVPRRSPSRTAAGRYGEAAK